MKKRILSMLLVIVMVVGLVPTAMAADGDALTTVEQLQAAINEGGTVKLGGNIDLGSSVLTFPDNIPVTIDLNGNTLSKSSSGYVLELGEGDDVTITGEGTVSKAGGWYFFKNDSGYLKIEGGTYSKSGYDLVYMGGNSVTEITGGTFALDNIFARQSDNSTGTISDGAFTVATVVTGIWDRGISITGGTFSIDPTQYGVDTDNYTVTENADNSYTVSEKIAVPVIYTVTITADKNTVTVGETVTLTAVVTADGNVVSDAQVDWEAPSGNGLDALGSLQATITPGSAGEIEVKAFYDPTPEDVENDDVVEGSVTVTAKETPVITVEFEPNNQITTEGKIIESLLYQVSVSDGSTPSYQWYQCDDAGRTNARAIEGATRMGFDLPKDLTEGKYYYYCVASAEGAQSTTSRVTTVTVKKAYHFAVTADPTEGGTVTAAVGSNSNVTSAIEGTNIRLSATANEGYIFAGWTVDGNIVSAEANYVFTMPTADTAVTATFTRPLPGKVVVDGIDLVNGDTDHTITCGDGTAVYDPDTQTLTLTNAEITYPSDTSRCAGIYISGFTSPVTVTPVGENSITLTDTAYDNNGIWNDAAAMLRITGEGSLDVLTYSDASPFGIWTRNGELYVEDAALSFELAAGSANNGFLVDTNKDITVSGASITAEGYLQNLFTGSDMNLADAEIDIVGGECVLYADGNISIEDSTISATATDTAAICLWGDLTIADSDVTAHSEWDNGLYCYGEVVVSGGKATITSTENDAFRANGGITITDNAEVAAQGYGAGVYTNEILSVESGSLTAKGENWAILARRISENGEGSKPTNDPAAIALGQVLVEISGAAIKTDDWVYTEVWDDYDWDYYDKWMSRSYFVDENGDKLAEATIISGYLVEYKAGAYGTGNEDSAIKIPGKPLVLADAIFTRDNYTQIGWAATDGGEKAYDLNGSYTADAESVLYPVWKANRVQLTATQTVTEANWYPDMSMRVSNLEDFFTVTKADGSAFTMFDVVVTDSQGAAVEYLENAGTYTLTLTMGAYYQQNYVFAEDTFTFTVKPLDLTSTRVSTFTALNPTYTGQTALPTATTSGKLNFRVYIYNAFVGSEKMYTVDANDGLWEFAAIDGKNSVEAGDAWANVVSKSSNIIGTYEYKYTIKQAEMDVPTGLVAVNETIDGKGDGKITGLTTAMEYGTSKYGTYTPVTDANMLFKDDTYYVRTAAPSENYEASDPVELTIEAGRKLTVTLPGEQQHYTLTASKTELSWHGSTTLTIAFDTGYGAGEDFAVLVNNKPVTPANNKVTVSDVEEDMVVTVTGVQANRYTVTFDTNGGEAIDPITVTYGEKYGRLPSSAITGLSGGDSNWYLVDESGNVTDTKITNLSVVTTARNHTLKVVRKVLAPTLKITLEVPGAISDGYQYYVPGNSTRVLTAAVNNENKDVLNYTYQWYKDGTPIEGATEAVLTLAGNVSDSGTYKVVVTATLKDGTGIAVTESSASGEKEQTVKILHVANTLSYDANGGENAPGNHYTGGATITVASDVPSREHYTFAGWNTKTDGSGDSYSAGSTYTFADDNGNGGCKDMLYAKWTANTYAVTLVTNQGTIRDGDVTAYTYGVGAVLPTNVTRLGYKFVGWYDNEDCTGDPVTEITDTEYGDKTFYAKWKRNSTGSGYRPEINDDGNGDVSVYPTKPEKGDIVTIRPDPDKGYEVDKVTVTDKNGRSVKVVDNGDGTYSFKQPDGKVEITVTFKEIGIDCDRNYTCPMYGYHDLSVTAWYHDGIHFCLEEGLMNGISNDQFAPNGTTTRAMIVTILWRLEGKPIVNYLMQFKDVAADMWYTEAIRWAASEKIVEGYGDTFGPNDPITREQMAAIMWRYAKHKGYDVSVGENTNILSYDDAFDVAEWAIPAMQWACGAGLINGIENGKTVNLAPNGNTTRAQAATILQRFIENIVNEK